MMLPSRTLRSTYEATKTNK